MSMPAFLPDLDPFQSPRRTRVAVSRTQMVSSKKSFNQPAKLAAVRVLAQGDGEAELGEPNPKRFGAHEVGDR